MRCGIIDPPQIGEHGEPFLTIDRAEGLRQDGVVGLTRIECLRIKIALEHGKPGESVVDRERLRQHRQTGTEQHGLQAQQPVFIGHVHPVVSDQELVDAPVDAISVSLGDRLGVRRQLFEELGQLFFRIADGAKKNVGRDHTGAEQRRERAARLATEGVHLPQPVLGNGVAHGLEDVVEIAPLDEPDALGIAGRGHRIVGDARPRIGSGNARVVRLDGLT